MEDVWFIGPLMIKEKWILYAVAAIVGYLVLKIATKAKGINQGIIESISNAAMVFLVTWKVSYVIFHPLQTLENPISLLYFTGGEKGIVFGIITILFYFYMRSKKENFRYPIYIEMTLITLLSALCTYDLGRLIFDGPFSIILLFDIALYFILLSFWWMKYNSDRLLWTEVLLWFSLGKLALSYFEIQLSLLLGFSFEQWVYIVLGIIAILFTFKKRNFKKS